MYKSSGEISVITIRSKLMSTSRVVMTRRRLKGKNKLIANNTWNDSLSFE